MKQVKMKIDFGNDTIDSEVQNQRLRQQGSAYLIAIRDTERVLRSIGTSRKGNSASSGSSVDESATAQCSGGTGISEKKKIEIRER